MEIKIEDILDAYDEKMLRLIRENAVLTAEKKAEQSEKFVLMEQLNKLQKEKEDDAK